ncbi:uncharacterized protein LOC127379587 isoform X2 [Dicentrarchus labrax]|nr:uncharacterized protein LOC127379587 isoform X2 [Dicentrarchus labrax]
MYVKDGLSPTVLSAVSGSFPPRTLVILTMFLLIQTCGGAEETSHEWPYMKVDTEPKAPLPSYLSEHPILLGFGVLAVFAILLTICSFCNKSTGVTENPSAESQQSPLDSPTEVLVHSSKKEKKKIVSKLMEQKKDVVKLMEDLQSQCLEVDREKVENKEKLQLVEKELENETVDNRQELLREKENLLESKWKLEEKKTNKEKVLLQTEKLLQIIDDVTGEEDHYIVSKLLEQKKDIVNLMKELQSQCLEVDRENMENKKKLQLVEKELENETVHNRQELLKEKENLLKSKWKLEEKKTNKEKVLLQTERLLQAIDDATGEEDKLQSRGGS